MVVELITKGPFVWCRSRPAGVELGVGKVDDDWTVEVDQLVKQGVSRDRCTYRMT